MLEFITFGKNCAPSIWDDGNSEQLECFFFLKDIVWIRVLFVYLSMFEFELIYFEKNIATFRPLIKLQGVIKVMCLILKLRQILQ